jgi:CarD family transcriptional regulator
MSEPLAQFNVGDFIVHPSYGVGHIVGIEKRQFADQETCLYYKIMLPKRTIWIPVEAQAALGLRLATAKGDLDQYRDLLTSPPAPLNKNYQKRHLELVARLKEGSFRVICEVVRDLTARSWQNALGSKDMATLQKTRESLYQEWATAAGISTSEAIKEVEALLRTTQQEFG